MLTEALKELSLESLDFDQNPPTFTTKYYYIQLVTVLNIRSFPLNLSDLTQNLHQMLKRENRRESNSTKTRAAQPLGSESRQLERAAQPKGRAPQPLERAAHPQP